MAIPPFNIAKTLPGDSDIVSQHPFNARAFRDTVESWLKINHDTNGNHFRIDIPRGSSPGTPAASIDVLYMTNTGRLKVVHPDATEEYIGVAPGTVVFTAGALDTGYLAADGSAVSRTTFSDLFTKIGTTFGAGDGSTTFNLPNIAGRVIAGIEAVATLLTTAGGGVNGAVMGSIGGVETITLDITKIPSHNHTLHDPGHFHNTNGLEVLNSILGYQPASNTFHFTTTSNLNTDTKTTGITIDAAGGGGAHSNTQPTIILRAQIRY